MYYKKKRKPLNIFYRDEMLEAYKIIKNDEITDKEIAINEIGSFKKFVKSLSHKFYTDLDKELKEMNDWYHENYKDSDKKQNDGKKANLYTKHIVDKKINDIMYLNNLYESGNLNEKTFYPLYKDGYNKSIYMNGGTDFKSHFNYLKKTTAVKNIDNEYLKRALDNLDEIVEAISKMLTPQVVKNMKYRAKIEKALDSTGYLDNYYYAEFIITEFINSNDSYKYKNFLYRYSINNERFEDCVKIIKFLNPVLYQEYELKLESNTAKRIYSSRGQFITLAKKIIDYRKQGAELPVEEYLKETPFKEYGYDYANKVNLFIENEGVKGTILSYLYRNNIQTFNNTYLSKELKVKRTINGREVTPEDIRNVFTIIEAKGLPKLDRVYMIVLKKYLAGEYDMNRLDEETEEKVCTKVKIPYVYKSVV